MADHSKLSPSSASRWLACPGSLTIESDEPTGSEYAAEGTVAHRLALQCFLLGVDPSEKVGTTWLADGFSIDVTEEMASHVDLYLRVIDSLGPVSLEHRIQHSGIQNFGGTIDCVAQGSCEIVDFKYGAGYAVEVEQNEQLGCYALLACDAFHGGSIVDYRLTVVQPRAHHVDGVIRTWTADRDWLIDLYERVKKAASGDRDTEFHAGAHCRWCPHRAQCPELQEMTLLTAKQEFSVPGMTPELAAKVLSKKKSIETYLEAVEQWAHGQLEKGQSIPGYKLVNTLGIRRYKFDEAKIVKVCGKAGFGKKQIYKSELLSPAQLEKVVGKELVETLAERPHTGTTVVPESDKRPAVRRMTASDEFAKLEDLETSKT